MLDSLSFDVVAALAPARSALGIARLLRWALRGLGAGALAGAVVLLAAHLWPFSAALPLALTALPAGLLAGTAIGIRSWPDSPEVARSVDRRFDLRDRLTTALEFQGSDAPLSVLQRENAARHVGGVPLRESGRGQLTRQEMGMVALALLVFSALLLLGGTPAPHSRSANQTTSGQAQIRKAATTRLPAIARKLEHGLTPQQRQTAALHKLDAALAKLRRQLLKSTTRSQALRAISATQQQLRHLAAGLHPIHPQAVSQLNRSLTKYMTPQQRSAAAGSSAKALAAATQNLNHLAKSLSHLTPAQRSALARSLARAANATSSSTLRSTLHQAASSLAYGDPQSAASALRQAAAALHQSPGSATEQSRLSSAGSQLDNLKNDVSGVGAPTSGGTSGRGNPGSGGKGSGKGSGSGKGTGQGKGTGSGQGKGAGSGQGKGSGSGSGQGKGTGTGQGSGNGKGQGQGSGSGSGQGGTGGHGIGGGRGGPGAHGRGRYATVYVPGTQHSGPHSVRLGPNGQPQTGQIIPYRQVIGQYQRTAHTALDHSALTPAQQRAVLRYFSSISH
jgi:hypothetical protein